MHCVCAIVLVTLLGTSRPSDQDQPCTWVEKTYTGQISTIQEVDNLYTLVTVHFTDGTEHFIVTTRERIRRNSVRVGASVLCRVDKVRSCIKGEEIIECSLASLVMTTRSQ